MFRSTGGFNPLKIVFLFVASLLLPHCAKYEQFSFHRPHEPAVVQNDVAVRLHVLDKYERKNLFKTNPDYFARKYRAVQIHIDNNSNEEYRLAGVNVSQTLESYKNVRRRLEENDVWATAFKDPLERRLENIEAKDEEERVKHKTINTDSVIRIPAGLSHTGIFLIRQENFYSDVTIKLVDKHNKQPLYFDMLMHEF